MQTYKVSNVSEEELREWLEEQGAGAEGLDRRRAGFATVPTHA